MKKNHRWEVIELRGKKAVVKIGMLPIHVDIKDLVLVKSKQDETGKK
jgi:DNA mismatch repair protein MutS2